MPENKMYKTEMCRNHIEHGKCKYNERCQFAHSIYELRKVERHPKYKTEVCKNFLDNSFCKYGKRCCFLHVEDWNKVTRDSYDSKRLYLKSSIETSLGFQGIWKKEKDGNDLYGDRDLSNGALHGENQSPELVSIEISGEKIGNSLGRNHALVWTSNPVIYIEEKHKKYYERSVQNMAPGEPVLPNYE